MADIAKKRVLVAGPFVGELGWEMFSWQPRVRSAAIRGIGYDQVLVYTGPGRRWLYRFAETRTLPDIPKHEPECLAWSNGKAHKTEFEEQIKRTHDAAAAELSDDKFDFLSYHNIGRMNDPMYGLGQPDFLYPDPSPKPSRFWKDDGRPKIVLCVRNRSMADHRNWSEENWHRLATVLGLSYDVVVVGTKPLELPDTVTDATTQTTIDDLIELFSQADMAVGGSTGTLHLASRCGCDHLVWGAENSTIFPLSQRYAETNWFGAKHVVLTDDAWEPDPDKIAFEIDHFLIEWKREKKGRVVITFDDCTFDHVIAASLLDHLGLRGTFGAVTNLIGKPGYPGWDELQQMASNGHCICNHSYDHARICSDAERSHLTPVGRAGITERAVLAREELESRGLDGRIYMAPFGTGNIDGQEHLDELLSVVDFVRLTIGTPVSGGWVNAGMHRHLPSGWQGNVCGITAAADVRWPKRVAERVHECVTKGTTCILTYHSVTHVVGETMALTWPMFCRDMQFIANMVKSGKLDSITLRGLMK